jgi:hypothetical protein
MTARAAYYVAQQKAPPKFGRIRQGVCPDRNSATRVSGTQVPIFITILYKYILIMDMVDIQNTPPPVKLPNYVVMRMILIQLKRRMTAHPGASMY